jgi:hypothetical protein
MNITYGQRQNDIDHLVFADHTIVNECKNVKENFMMWYSWFTSHVVDRFADSLPVAQHYARTLGYPVKSITFTLTIPYLNTEPTVKKAMKGLGIKVIQTGKQLLKEEDKKLWYPRIRKQILSVINSISSNIEYSNRSRSNNKIRRYSRTSKPYDSNITHFTQNILFLHLISLI